MMLPEHQGDLHLQVIETAHEVGLPTTSTIMFGHVDGPASWARHLAAIRSLQVIPSRAPGSRMLSHALSQPQRAGRMQSECQT